MPNVPDDLIEDRDSDTAERSLQVVADRCRRAERPIRMRVTISLFDPTANTYRGWRGMVWKVTVKDLDDAREFQQALEEFFDLYDTAGAERTKEWVAYTKQQLQAAMDAMDRAVDAARAAIDKPGQAAVEGGHGDRSDRSPSPSTT